MRYTAPACSLQEFARDLRESRSGDPDGVDWDLSPGGERVAVMLPRGHIRILDLASGRDEDVPVRKWKQLHEIDWSADSRSLLTIGTDLEGNSAVLQVDMKGEAQELIMTPKSLPLLWAIPSPNGHFLAVMGKAGQRNVWLVNGF